MKFNKILITGGAGFIGSQFIRRVLDKSEHIFVIDDLSTGSRDAIPSSSKITFIEDSITNKKTLKNIMPHVSHIFHFACANLSQSTKNLAHDFDTNLYGTFSLLSHAHKYCSNLQRFIYTSTSCIYSEAKNLPTPETQYDIKLPYAASKLSAEHYCNVFHYLYNQPTVVLRLSNVYGPGQSISNPYCGVVARFFTNALQNKPFTIYGDGSQTRDFTFVDDVLSAILLATINSLAIGKTFNIGTGIETSINNLAKMITTITHANQPIIYKPKRDIDIVNRRSIDASKIRNLLSWNVQHQLEEGLKKTYHWSLTEV